MLKYLSAEQTEKIHTEYLDVKSEFAALLMDLVLLADALSSEEAAKYCRHGLGRRAGHIRKCLERFHEIFEYEIAGEEITERMRFEQEAFLYTFLIDISGGLDNLIKVVASEKGFALRKAEISFNRIEGRKLLPDSAADKYFTYDKWFAYLKDFRDSLAHRITPYIPPYVVDQNGIKSYESFYTHDFDTSPHIYFHPQIICDAKTFSEVVRLGLSGVPEWPEAKWSSRCLMQN